MHNNCLVYFHLSTFWGFIYAVIECKYLYHISTYIQYDVGLFVCVNSLIYLYSTLQYFSEYILHLPSPHYTANPKLKTKTREKQTNCTQSGRICTIALDYCNSKRKYCRNQCTTYMERKYMNLFLTPSGIKHCKIHNNQKCIKMIFTPTL